ncbi:unnamed protein product [Spirodela intermedia]|uniref:Peptidase C14 caspase domain-containing protein n=1 Tax=Spirodela intermedia TaxID=51605 RepID=A0A7I8IAR5_SPIIN|nr:unnamed protein product [Spirodela intermedia]CAA6654443.1 unnamed protein product [Spirodela intermedia]
MEGGKKRLATLVGCDYANTANELHGCINDVRTMQELLIRRFGFHPQDVEVITDAPGAAVLPTGATIRAALSRMVDRAAAGDVLFFHYSGHGTWFPSGNRREEAIVPCDFNLITVDRPPPAGTSFTIVSDSCHSGGLIDKEKEQIGSTSARSRAIPYEAILSHLSSLSGIQSPHIGDHLAGVFGDTASPNFLGFHRGGRRRLPEANDGILLSGCQANETSADISGGDDPAAAAYGAFSHAIQTVLREHEAPLSNRELVEKTRLLLAQHHFTQHPGLYCSDENAAAAFLRQEEEEEPPSSKGRILNDL